MISSTVPILPKDLQTYPRIGVPAQTLILDGVVQQATEYFLGYQAFHGYRSQSEESVVPRKQALQRLRPGLAFSRDGLQLPCLQTVHDLIKRDLGRITRFL